LARRIQDYGTGIAACAAERAADDGRKTLMVEDFDRSHNPKHEELTLPIAPIDRIARLDIDDRYRVSQDARYVLGAILETYALEAAKGATILAEHAGRRTIQMEDIETYFRLVE
jgi:histone H3/H4